LKLDKITLFVTVQMLHPQHYLGEAKNIYIIFVTIQDNKRQTLS